MAKFLGKTVIARESVTAENVKAYLEVKGKTLLLPDIHTGRERMEQAQQEIIKKEFSTSEMNFGSAALRFEDAAEDFVREGNLPAYIKAQKNAGLFRIKQGFERLKIDTALFTDSEVLGLAGDIYENGALSQRALERLRRVAIFKESATQNETHMALEAVERWLGTHDASWGKRLISLANEESYNELRKYVSASDQRPISTYIYFKGGELLPQNVPIFTGKERVQMAAKSISKGNFREAATELEWAAQTFMKESNPQAYIKAQKNAGLFSIISGFEQLKIYTKPLTVPELLGLAEDISVNRSLTYENHSISWGNMLISIANMESYNELRKFISDKDPRQKTFLEKRKQMEQYMRRELEVL